MEGKKNKRREEIEKIAYEIRLRILKTGCTGRSGHIATSLSATDILTELYFGDILSYRPDNPSWSERDRFVLSKGHASLLLYNILGLAGYFDISLLKDYCQPGTKFGSHPTIEIPGVEASTGALGHGYPYSVGVAMAARMNSEKHLVYCMLGDGECQEGSVWEAANAVIKYNLTNLVTIVDCNKLQATGFTKDIIGKSELSEKFQAWGFDAIEIDGHNFDEIRNALLLDKDNLPKKPRAVIANTVKGKGIPMLENNPLWHSKVPNNEELEKILLEIGVTREEYEKL